MKAYEIVQCNQGFMVRPAPDYSRAESAMTREVYCFSNFQEAVDFVAKRFGL